MEIKASISFSILKGSRQMPTRMTRALLQTGRAACLPGTPCNTACKKSSTTPESTAGNSSQGCVSRSLLSAEAYTWAYSCWSSSHSHSTSNKRRSFAVWAIPHGRKRKGCLAHFRHQTEAAARTGQGHQKTVGSLCPTISQGTVKAC